MPTIQGVSSAFVTELPVTHKLSIAILTILLWALLLPGCVPVYCAFKNANPPESEELEMFAWETELDGATQPHSNDLAIMESSQTDRWIVFNKSYHDNDKTMQIVVDQNGNYIETLPYRDMRRNSPHRKFRKYETYTLFTDEPEAYANANISVEIERNSYPPLLEVEAWLRQTLGRIVAPFMGKAGARLIHMPYESTECCPPYLAITTTQPDGNTSTRRFTFPEYNIDGHNPLGTLVSNDGRFLYIYFKDQATLIGLN